MDINKQWKETCRILLGQEIGGIDEYSSYLQKFVPLVRIENSILSGKDVAVGQEYGEKARFNSGDEMEQYQKMLEKKKLDINQIKDLDSIVEAMQERICYAGNIHLGKSTNIQQSNRLIDSTSVHNSTDVFYSQHVASSNLIRYCEYIFGSMDVAKTKFAIRGFEAFESSRMFEVVRVYHSSDCYYTVNLDGCHNCMFCFNVRNKRNCIGNLELPTDKFNSIKKKLIEDIRTTLGSKKHAISVIEIVGETND